MRYSISCTALSAEKERNRPVSLKNAVSLTCFCLSLLFGHVAAARSLVIGTISDESVKEARVFMPFAEYLAAQLQDEGITAGEVRIARNIAHMAELLRSGEVDVFVDSPLVSLAVRAKCGSRLVARRWKKGVAEYRSVVFVRRDSGIQSLEDLKGRVIAFEEAFSSSGYILPRHTIATQGVQLAAMSGPRAARPAEATGYVFSGDDENTIEWVLRGLVDAGAMSLNGLKKRAGDDIGSLDVLVQTENIPRHVVSLSPGTSDEFTAAVQAVLISMDQNDEGRWILENFERTTKFDAIPDQTLDMLEEFEEPVTALIGGN
ncbi:phosphate/phosphite/phosphonate ABC transporter substrate-binding protein [Leisingera sp. McT4-56]|uniref:phosphate/phosphite/phosphonate ABC transporter substrate-binding protein n=1 Tax=Leisingera sp. McT4-56 TaxID=2881255 RepID=UPI001CF90185|nr:phosphate/phosphite/phosphonate ABC transporter substrate-binding protein [Leisingera sp. McT4-56]MCB4455643.1 phosphate/phosphite/phosphonate ABC transporter substrate-binding protein [Leisingera sp. McT4-56]